MRGWLRQRKNLILSTVAWVIGFTAGLVIRSNPWLAFVGITVCGLISGFIAGKADYSRRRCVAIWEWSSVLGVATRSSDQDVLRELKISV